MSTDIALADSRNFTTVINPVTRALETINIFTGELAVSSVDMSAYVYSDALCDAICNLVREGKTLTEISKLDNMPPQYMISLWLSGNKEFKAKMRQAERDRASIYHDKAVDALDTMDKIEANDGELELKIRKTQFDGYLKLAEKGDPDRYSQKPNNDGILGGGKIIVINTGLSNRRLGEEMDEQDGCSNERGEMDTIEGIFRECRSAGEGEAGSVEDSSGEEGLEEGQL